ncbi:hypothetical protein J6590_057821 [Homalodisca vitripennis]|nr:hypothetical protein J6590_057821 [Homalodisca vitripennis]
MKIDRKSILRAPRGLPARTDLTCKESQVSGCPSREKDTLSCGSENFLMPMAQCSGTGSSNAERGICLDG